MDISKNGDFMVFWQKNKKINMEQEILEQPAVIAALIDKYVKNYVLVLDIPLNVDNIKIIASGSSYNCALLGKRFFELISGVKTDVEFSGEFLCEKSRIIDKNTLYFFISQSGETYDTTSAAKIIKESGCKTFAIVNNENSTLWELCDYKININAGVENSIAATKSFSASLCVLYLCAIKIAQNKLKDVTGYMKNIKETQENIQNIINKTKNIDKAADFLAKYAAFPVVGQGVNYALARECALKIKETSYIDVNAYSMGEFVHGHVAVLNKIDTLIEIITSDFCEFELKTLTKIKKDYNPKNIVITDCDEYFEEKISILMPHCEDMLVRVLGVLIVSQLLALKIALKLKRDVDKPQGLNKVVS